MTNPRNPIRLEVNGTSYDVAVDAKMPLLWVLRDELGLVGTKYGCGIGLCGSCTVHIDGEAARACVVEVAGLKATQDIVTIEGRKVTIHDRDAMVSLRSG